eukprot:gb/GECG01004829.1/.p1 GENE.gb/GECG01004829.1/~~gb/GECG01004829.1/.p1  ORF type:complete len:462 (+),score=85.39 gb/GECG01004829.1/:1-1386(+)
MKVTAFFVVVAVSMAAVIPVEQAEGSLIPYDFARKLLRVERSQPRETAGEGSSAEAAGHNKRNKKHHLALLLMDHPQRHDHPRNSVQEQEAGEGNHHHRRHHRDHDLQGDAIGGNPVIVPQKYGGHRRHPHNGRRNHHNGGREAVQHESGSRTLQDFEEPIFEGFPQNQRGKKMLVGVPDEHGIVFPEVNAGRRGGRTSRLAIRNHGPHSILRKIPVHSEEDELRLPSIPSGNEVNEDNFHVTVYTADKNGKVKKVYDSSEATPQEQQERKDEISAWMNEMRRQQEAMDSMFKELLTAPRLRGRAFPFPSIKWEELEKAFEDGQGQTDGSSGSDEQGDQTEESNEGSDSVDGNTKDSGSGNKNSGSSHTVTGSSDSSASNKGAKPSDSAGLIVGVVGAVLTVATLAILVVVKLRKQRGPEQTIDVPTDDHYINIEKTSNAFAPQPPQRSAAQHDQYVRLEE